MIYAGCDLGTISAKAVIIENGNILAAEILPYKNLPKQAAIQVMEMAIKKAGLTKDRICLLFIHRFWEKSGFFCRQRHPGVGLP